MSVAREGYRLILTFGALALVALILGWTLIGIILVLVTLAVSAFFRDPDRIVPAGENIVLIKTTELAFKADHTYQLTLDGLKADWSVELRAIDETAG